MNSKTKKAIFYREFLKTSIKTKPQSPFGPESCLTIFATSWRKTAFNMQEDQS